MTATVPLPAAHGGLAAAPPITLPVIAAIALMVAPGQFDSYSIVGLPGAIGRDFAKIVEGISIAIVTGGLVLQRWVPRFNIPLAFATLYLAQAMLSGLTATDEAGFSYAAAKTLRTGAAMFVMFFAIKTRRDLDHVLLGLKGVSVGAAILVIIEVTFPGWRLDSMFGAGRGHNVSAMIQFEESLGSFVRARGPMSHPNWLGFYYGATLMLPLYFWYRYTSTRARAINAFCTFLELVALTYGYVRLGVVGVAVGTFWIIIRGGVKYRAATLGGIALAGALVYPLMPEAWIGRITDPDVWAEDKSLEMRLSQQFANIDLIMDHGGTGVGFGGYGEVFFNEADGHAAAHFRQVQMWFGDKFKLASVGSHNCYLEIMLEQGILGITLFVALWLAAYFGILGSYSRNRGDPTAQQLGRCFEGMIVAIVVMNGVIHTQERRVQWIVIGLVCAFLSLTRYDLIRLDAKPCDAPTRSAVMHTKLRLALLALVLAGSAWLLSEVPATGGA